MSEDNIHPVVELLAARMESHPEEFGHKGSGRWAAWLEPLMRLATDEEKLLLRSRRMDEIHEEVLDELLNGEERRAQEKRERDLETQRMMAQVQQAALQPGQYAQVQSLSALQGMGIGSVAPSQPLVIRSGGKEAMRIEANGDIKIGNETLSEGLLKSIKGKLGL